MGVTLGPGRRKTSEPNSPKRAFASTVEGGPISMQWNRLSSGLTNLVSAASQLAENGAISELQQIEIRVRLAELESLMDAVQWQINSHV